jgi:hypothetical protein
MDEKWTLREQREYAWNYFELHARQRMSVFNYFVLIAALLTAGLAGSFSKSGSSLLISIISLLLAISLVVISFVFWKLDQRVRQLIKHAEEALKMLEKHSTSCDTNIHKHLSLFSEEEKFTEKLRTKYKKKNIFSPWLWHMSYYQCFRIIYIVFSFIGLLGIILSLIGLLKLLVCSIIELSSSLS